MKTIYFRDMHCVFVKLNMFTQRGKAGMWFLLPVRKMIFVFKLFFLLINPAVT